MKTVVTKCRKNKYYVQIAFHQFKLIKNVSLCSHFRYDAKTISQNKTYLSGQHRQDTHPHTYAQEKGGSTEKQFYKFRKCHKPGHRNIKTELKNVSQFRDTKRLKRKIHSSEV